MKLLPALLGLLALCVLEILRVYFIMPFPGSQKMDVVQLAYWLDQNIFWIRITGVVLLFYPIAKTIQQETTWKKITILITIAAYCTIFYLFNFRFLAEKMFYQPGQILFANAVDNKISPEKLVLGIEINGESKAYPIQLIGYHHQVRDTVGGTPVMVTYCTVCRTGRIFSPIVNGKPENFRLVGMDHFNAMFEDASTKSWWRQVSGEAIVGPLKGTVLEEMPSKQMTLEAWLRLYPSTSILQPDSTYKAEYADLEGYDNGTVKSSLEKRDSLSWKPKSWVIGIVHGTTAKAYDWNNLVAKKMIQDSLPGLPVLLLLENDSATFHTWNRMVEGRTLHFLKDSTGLQLTDQETGSVWNLNGRCLEGKLSGTNLKTIRSSQEFWHSWKDFNPNTLRD